MQYRDTMKRQLNCELQVGDKMIGRETVCTFRAPQNMYISNEL